MGTLIPATQKINDDMLLCVHLCVHTERDRMNDQQVMGEREEDRETEYETMNEYTSPWSTWTHGLILATLPLAMM